MAATSLRDSFAEQVQRTPDAVAVSSGRTRLTYRELDERANLLAHRLIERGLAPEATVAVLMERSIELVVAVLAVVKAGGTYLALHEAYPAERKQWIIDRSGTSLLIADETMRARGLPEVADVVFAGSVPAGPPVPAPDRAIHPDQLACVIYTSGSTGEPKGVALTNRGVLSVVRDSSWDTGRHRRLLMVAPYAFAASTYELWVPLLRGGELVLAPPGDLEIHRLRGLIAEHGITGLHLTAGLFRVVAEEDPTCLASVQEVLVGGDIVSPTAVNRIREACPDTAVRVTYGTTESTLFTVTMPTELRPDREAAVPIGFPMDETRVYILDDRLAPVTPGELGEMYLAGTRITRGYLGRPDLTAERFVPDPFTGSGERMYRTGDLVRLTPEGAILLTGRADDQVKVRGFRVELPEVEAVLAKHPGSAQVVVVAQHLGDEDKRLVAYLVPERGGVDVAALRAHAESALPDYMVPSAYVTLDELPLTANGKLDRKALPLPEEQSGSGYRAPRDGREEQLCRIFAEVLDVERVGIDDDFFELGGQSLSAMKLLNRIRTALGVDVSIETLFDISTVAGLSVRFAAEKNAA
jgi:amino acid adenylation domain-containing protein